MKYATGFDTDSLADFTYDPARLSASGGLVGGVSGSGGGPATLTAAPVANQFAAVMFVNAVSGEAQGALVRVQGRPTTTAGIDGYGLVRSTTTSVVLRKYISTGADVDLATYSTVNAAEDVLELRANGSTLTAVLNGTVLGAVTDSDYPTGYVGFNHQRDTGHTITAFFGGDLGLLIRRPAGKMRRREFLSSGTWTKPDGLKYARVICVGGGGGGGSGRFTGTGNSSAGGSGGAGGCYSVHAFRESSIPSTVAVTVGAGGAGAAPKTTNGTGTGGTAGGTSSFGSLLRAVGGNLGIGGGTAATAAAAATSGATDLNAASGSVTSSGGQNAPNVAVTRAAGGGGGGGFINSTDQIVGGVGSGGINTVTGRGSGGRGGAASLTSAPGEDGQPGIFPGGGGGGSGPAITTMGAPSSGKGGDGANGIVIVEEYF